MVRLSAALCLPGVDTLPPVALRQKALSQWFTPPALATRLVRWCGGIPAMRALEPSAGNGQILRALRERSEGTEIDAVELDPRFAGKLMGFDQLVHVECCDYLTRPAPQRLYDLTVMNPPYEDGADGRFIAKAMDESERVIALCRLNVVTGKGRHERVWSRVDSGEWDLVGLAFLVGRPSFSAAGEESDSPLSDFVAIKLRRPANLPRVETAVEWWT